MGMGRVTAETTVALLFSRAFWGVVAVCAVLTFLIDNPAVAVGLGVAVVALIAAAAWAAYRDSHTLQDRGRRLWIRDFQCTGCGLLGKLRIDRRVERVPGGTVRWPFVVCCSCGYEERVPGRVVG